MAHLYEAHARRVRLVCLHMLRNPQEADDALQQTFLSAYKSLLGGVAPRDAAAWLATIARNECRARIHDRMATPLSEFELADVPGRVDAADEAALREQLATVLAGIKELPQRERDAVVMQAFGGVSNAEVAARLGTTESAVESLLVRARAQLRARVWPVVAGARALVFAPTWLRSLFMSGGGGGGDLVAMGKVGTAVACVGTLVALGPATPGGQHGASFAGPRAAQASPVSVSGAAVAPARGRVDGRFGTSRTLPSRLPAPTRRRAAPPVARAEAGAAAGSLRRGDAAEIAEPEETDGGGGASGSGSGSSSGGGSGTSGGPGPSGTSSTSSGSGSGSSSSGSDDGGSIDDSSSGSGGSSGPSGGAVASDDGSSGSSSGSGSGSGSGSTSTSTSGSGSGSGSSGSGSSGSGSGSSGGSSGSVTATTVVDDD